MIAHGLFSFKFVGRPKLKVLTMNDQVGVQVHDRGDPADVNNLGIWTAREHEEAILRATAAWNSIMDEEPDDRL